MLCCHSTVYQPIISLLMSLLLNAGLELRLWTNKRVCITAWKKSLKEKASAVTNNDDACVYHSRSFSSHRRLLSVLLVNRLQALSVNLPLLTESGFYLLLPFLRPSVFTLSHPSTVSHFLLASQFLILSCLSWPPPQHTHPCPCEWYNHLWLLTWPMTIRLSGWQCKPLSRDKTAHWDNWPDKRGAHMQRWS